MIPIPTLIIRIAVERIVGHQVFAEIIVRVRIVRIGSISYLATIRNAVRVGVFQVWIRAPRSFLCIA